MHGIMSHHKPISHTNYPSSGVFNVTVAGIATVALRHTKDPRVLSVTVAVTVTITLI